MPDMDQVQKALRTVVDPEVGINIVDLGLVYGVELSRDAIKVSLTMTSPACPMSDLVISDAENALHYLVDDETEIHIDLVWSPPWDPSKMSDKARETLGW